MTTHKYGVDAFYQSLINLKSYGREVTVRGMTTTEILGHSFEVLNPVSRFMLLPFRKCNPFAQLAEAIWMIAGRNDLDWLEFYIPSCKKWSDDGCFTGDTLIKLLDGTLTPIKDLVNLDEFYVYSYDQKSEFVHPGKGHACKITGHKKIYAVILDNGQLVKCTGNHRFLLRDGSYKRADKLCTGDSLMPLYTQYNEKGYEELLHPNKGWECTHQAVMHKELQDGYPDSNTVHHIDFNKCNNDPRNLKVMNFYDHFNYHSELKSEEMIERWKNPEYREHMSKCISRSSKKRWENEEYAKKMSRSSKKRWENEEYKEYMRQVVIESNKTSNKWWESEESRKKFTEKSSPKQLQRWEEDDGTWLAKSCDALEIAQEIQKIAFEQNNELAQKLREVRSQTMTSLNTRTINGKKAAKVYSDKSRNNMLNKLLQSIQDKGLQVTQETYNNAKKELGNAANFLPKTLPNHKVVCVQELGYEDVYDFTVDGYHNFALGAGVFVHNSTWRDAYGPRLRNYGAQYEWSYNGWQPVGPVVDQLANAVNKLKQDIHSRQIILTIWNPMMDWIENSKAYPCNIALQFMVRNDFLHMFVTVRSNDVVYGFSHNDFFSWSLLLQMMAYWIGCKVGSLHWNASSFHIYDRHYDLSQQIISKTPSRYFIYDYDVPTLGFSTLFDKIDGELERIFGWEKATEFITYCTELVDPGYEFSSDVLLDAITRMLLIYRYYKGGAHKDFIVSAVKAMGYSDFQLAAIDYLARDPDYKVDDFGFTQQNFEAMEYLVNIQQLQR